LGDKITASRNFAHPPVQSASPGRIPNANHFPAHLFRSWQQLKSRLNSAQRCALFLVPLRPRPADVQLSRQTRKILALLQRHKNLHLSFVSGRQLKVLRNIIGMDQVHYVGLHGAERESESLCMSEESLGALSRAKLCAQKQLCGLPGIWMEDKGLSFALHYWKARPATIRAADLALREFLEPELGVLHVLNGNRVWEVMPKEIPGKGVAVRALLDTLPENTLGIYVGDDVTDETAQSSRGLPISVAPRNTTGISSLFP
jgi:trehalose 6-phosphate phosphatase